MKKLILLLISLVALISFSACNHNTGNSNETVIKINNNNLLTAYGEFISLEGYFLWKLVHEYGDTPYKSYPYIDGYMANRAAKVRHVIKLDAKEELANHYNNNILSNIDNSIKGLQNLNNSLKQYFKKSDSIKQGELDKLNKNLEELYLSISNIGPGGSESLVLYHVITNPVAITENYTEEEIMAHLDKVNNHIAKLINFTSNTN